jgi:hypothetical protein
MRNGPPHGPASMSRAVHEGLHHETGREEAAASPPSRAVSPPIPRRHVPRDVAAALRAADAPRPGASLDYRQTAGAVINPRLPPDRRWIRAASPAGAGAPAAPPRRPGPPPPCPAPTPRRAHAVTRSRRSESLRGGPAMAPPHRPMPACVSEVTCPAPGDGRSEGSSDYWRILTGSIIKYRRRAR